MPSVNSFETDMKKLRRKRRAKRNIKNFSFIMAVVLVTGLIYLSRDAWLDYFDGILAKAQTAAVQNDGELAAGNYPIDISKKTHTAIGTIQRYWTLYADTTFYVYNSSGDTVYTAQASYSNPIVLASDKRTLIYDQGGYSFTLAGPRKVIYTKKLNEQILLGAVGADGSVAIVTSTEKFNSYLTVYDKNGSEIYHWADGSMIMSIALSQNGSGCLISSSFARGGTYRTVVTRLDFKSTEVSMQSQSLETLGLSVGYANGNGIWLVGDNMAYRLNESGEVEESFEYSYDLIDYSMSSRLLVLVYEGAGQQKGSTVILSASDTDTADIAADEDINDVYNDGSTVYVLYDSRLDAYDRFGNLLATAPTDTVYRSFAVSGNEVFLLGYHSVNKIEFNI